MLVYSRKNTCALRVSFRFSPYSFLPSFLPRKMAVEGRRLQLARREPHLPTVTEVKLTLNTTQKRHTTSNVVLEAAGHGVSLEADAQQHELQEHGSIDYNDKYVEMEMRRLHMSFVRGNAGLYGALLQVFQSVLVCTLCHYSMQMNMLCSQTSTLC
jgi:hypothetical protein